MDNSFIFREVDGINDKKNILDPKTFLESNNGELISKINIKDDNSFKIIIIDSLDRALEIAGSDTKLNYRRSSIDGNKEFTGTDSLEEAIDLGLYGWRDKIDKVSKISESIKNIVGSKIEIEIEDNDIAGDELDVTAFASGEIECMLNFDIEEKDGNGKLIDIYVNISTPASVGAKAIMNRGASVAAISEILKSSGYNTRILIYSYVTEDEHKNITAIKLKDYQDVVDISVISFALINPSMLRRIVFSINEHMPKSYIEDLGFKTSGGYGTPGNVFLGGDIYMPILIGREEEDYSTDEKSANKIIEFLKNCKGVILNEV